MSYTESTLPCGPGPEAAELVPIAHQPGLTVTAPFWPPQVEWGGGGAWRVSRMSCSSWDSPSGNASGQQVTITVLNEEEHSCTFSRGPSVMSGAPEN